MNLTRITVLFVLVAFFSVTAHAYDLSTFRLRIEDPDTNIGRVIYNDVKLGIGNLNGDGSFLTANQIYFSGYVENFFVTIQGTSTTVNPDGTGGGVLSLSARVSYSQASSARIMITLEDTGYSAPTPPVAFVSSIGGFNSATRTVTSAGDLTGGAQSVNLQSWLDVNNTLPEFGVNSGAVALNPLSTTIPPPGSNTFTAFNGSGQLFQSSQGPTFSANNGAGVPVPLAASQYYSMFSQATVVFVGSGDADFTLTASDPYAPGNNSVPEPTSLMLLGSALLGLGILRRKQQI